MAITFINSANGGTLSATTFSITLPATQAGDIIILEYVHRGTADATLGGTYNGPAFTEKHDQQFASSTFSAKTLWSRATGNHSGQTVTGSGLTNSCAAIVTVYRGCLTSGDPLADATIVGEQNASGNETQAEITTATNGAWVVLVVANSPDVALSAQTCTSPGTLTERVEVLSTAGTDTSIGHASAEKTTAGATGAFTWSQTDGASGSWAYAIKPDISPTITSIDGDNNTVDTRTGVAIVGTNFGASETGSAKVEVSNNATYGSGTIVEVDVTSWSATSITVTLRRESDSAALGTLLTLPLSPAYLWVTESTGLRNATGFSFTLNAAGATWLAALDTTTTIDVSSANVQKRLRGSVENTGGAAGGTGFKWQYRKNGGTWTDITASSSNVKTFSSAYFADGDDVPQLITGGTYQSDNNAAEESTGTFTLGAGLPAAAIFESEIALEFIKADLAHNDTLDFRIVTSAGVALDTYDVTPQVTIQEEVTSVGTLAVTLGALTATTDADAISAGSATSTLGALTSTTDVDALVIGSASPTLGALTSTTDADAIAAGAAAQTLGTLTLSGTGVLLAVITGTLSVTLGTLTSTSDADAIATGTGAATLGVLTVTTDADARVGGTLAATLGTLTVTADADAIATGAAAVTLGALSSASDVDVLALGTSSQTLGALTSTTDGDAQVVGAASVALGALTLSATGSAVAAITGDLSVTLGTLSSSTDADVIASATASQTLGVLTATTDADTIATGQSTITLGVLTLSATSVALLQGSLTQTLGALGSTTEADTLLAGSLSQTLGAATLSANATVISGRVGNLDLTLGALAVASSGVVSAGASLAVTLGALASTSDADALALGTSNQILGVLASTTDVDAKVAGASSVTLGALSLSATGGVTAAIVGNLSVTLGALTATTDADVLSAGALGQTLGAVTASTDADVTVIGSAAQTLGSLSSSADADAIATGQSSISLETLTLSATGGIFGGIGVLGDLDITLSLLTSTSEADALLTANLIQTLGDLIISDRCGHSWTISAANSLRRRAPSLSAYFQDPDSLRRRAPSLSAYFQNAGSLRQRVACPTTDADVTVIGSASPSLDVLTVSTETDIAA